MPQHQIHACIFPYLVNAALETDVNLNILSNVQGKDQARPDMFTMSLTSPCSPVTVYVHRKELKLPLTDYAGYKERNPDSHKGFIVLPSDRDVKNEVKYSIIICLHS